MDPRLNPYTPNAGARPAALVGRDAELEAFDVLLARLTRGYTEQSMLITGLRGVGKTVLLNEFEARARTGGWVSVEAEITRTRSSAGGWRCSPAARFCRSPRAPAGASACARAAGILKSFQITVSSEGTLTAGLDVDAQPGIADSGHLSDDLTDLFVALGEGAREHHTGVAFLIDEVQFLRAPELEALIMALHKGRCSGACR